VGLRRFGETVERCGKVKNVRAGRVKDSRLARSLDRHRLSEAGWK